jgi:hypothetical protein
MESNKNLEVAGARADISEYMTPSEFERFLDVDNKTIWRAENTGKIKPTMMGGVKMFHVKDSMQGWVDNTKKITMQNRDLIQRMSKEIGQELKNDPPEEEKPLPDVHPGIPDYVDSKRKTEYFVAKTKELEFKKRSGELVSKKEIEKSYFEFSRKMRDDILSLPMRLAPELAVENDPQKVELYLKNELTKLLEGLANA